MFGERYRQRAEKEISGFPVSDSIPPEVQLLSVQWAMSYPLIPYLPFNELTRVGFSYFQPSILTTIASVRRWASE